MKKVIITGGAGFIGHHLVQSLLKTTDWELVLLDKLNYASNGFNRLRDIGAVDNPRVKIFVSDLASGPISVGIAKEMGKINYIIHMAAETHVDNSITNPEPFVRSNVLGTFNLLEYAKTLDNLERFVYFSTDEVFGPAPKGVAYKEWDRYNSTNPYSATKAAGEELCLAWANTYKVPIAISHTMNAFGERQHPEKFIPKVVKSVLSGDSITIHSDPTKTISGSRFYIHCRNIAAAVQFILDNTDDPRDKYNIVGEKEVTNLALANSIADILGKPLNYTMTDFHSSRPGHDLRYALDGTKLRELGWNIPVPFETSLEKTIKWMTKPSNLQWLLM